MSETGSDYGSISSASAWLQSNALRLSSISREFQLDTKHRLALKINHMDDSEWDELKAKTVINHFNSLPDDGQ